MKRAFLLLVFLCNLHLISIGQLKVGLKAGANLSQILVTKTGNTQSNESFGSRIGFHAGSFVSNSFSEHLSWQLEVLFSSKGYNYNIENHSEKVSLNYLNWPLLLVYRPTAKLEFEFGPEFGYMITGKDLFSDFDLGFDLGARFDVSKRMNAGIRYNYGLPFKMKNVATSESTEHTYANSVFQVYLGINLLNNLTTQQVGN
jgi:hypothetical protein